MALGKTISRIAATIGLSSLIGCGSLLKEQESWHHNPLHAHEYSANATRRSVADYSCMLSKKRRGGIVEKKRFRQGTLIDSSVFPPFQGKVCQITTDIGFQGYMPTRWIEEDADCDGDVDSVFRVTPITVRGKILYKAEKYSQGPHTTQQLAHLMKQGAIKCIGNDDPGLVATIVDAYDNKQASAPMIAWGSSRRALRDPTRASSNPFKDFTRSAKGKGTGEISLKQDKIVEQGVGSIYFATDQSTLSPQAQRELERMITKEACQGPLTVIGRADRRGSEKYNFTLALNRAQETRDYVAGICENRGYSQMNARVVSFGEKEAQGTKGNEHEMAKDRRVEISGKHELTVALEQVARSTVYVVDASGSMQGRAWDAVLAFDLSGSECYGFNSIAGLNECTRISSPQGDTPLYDALQTVLERMKPGESLTVLTDGRETSSATPYLVLERLVDQSDVRISAILVGESYAPNIKRLVEKTGGEVLHVRAGM